MLIERNIETQIVSIEQFLSQTFLRKGIYDYYNNEKFHYYPDNSVATAYERGRHIAVIAKSQKLKLKDLYDHPYIPCRGKPTYRLEGCYRYMQRLGLTC